MKGEFDVEEPLYLRVAKLIKERLDSEAFKPHELIPSEPDLARKLKVSRSTVRAAIHLLEQCGFIYHLQGKGTYVSEPPKYCKHCGQAIPMEKPAWYFDSKTRFRSWLNNKMKSRNEGKK